MDEQADLVFAALDEDASGRLERAFYFAVIEEHLEALEDRPAAQPPPGWHTHVAAIRSALGSLAALEDPDI